MKKQILLFVLMLLPMVASADDSGSCGSFVTYTYIESTKTLIISGTGGINEYYSVSAPWINYKTSIQTIIIESGVTSIGRYAFNGCSGVTSVTIPNSVKYIDERAFGSCSRLTSVTIPNSVTSIGDGAFGGCSGLTLILVESNNPKYDSRNYCNAIIEKATNTLVLGCKNTLIPNDVTSIGIYAFSGCTGLTSVTIPNSVTSIGIYAFSGCTGLTSVTIPNSVTSIGGGAFSSCTGLTSVTIPNSVTSIGGSAFYKCSGLTTVAIPNSVTSIGNRTFEGCNGLTSVTIPNSVTSIGTQAFEGCSGLTSVNIPNSVTSIEERTFCYCSGLTSMNIPNSVTSIGNYAFFGCSGLTSVTIGNNVKSISDYAFQSCSRLTSVNIPNSVTEIGEEAFLSCNSLTTLTLPEDIKVIKKGTFKNCGIKSIVIPAKVEYIYAEAFACYWTQEVKVLATTPPWAHDNAFGNYNVPLYVPKESINDYQSTNPWSKFSPLKTLDGEDADMKCKTPTISYSKGKLTFNCETDGVEYQYSIADTDIKSGKGSDVQLSVTYIVKVYAEKSGYQNSDVATATLCWIDVDPKTEGITTGSSQIPAKAVLIQSQGGLLTIQGADDGTKIGVYNINGTLAGEGTSRNGCATVNTNLQPGSVAIIKIGDRSVKVVIK